MALNYAHGAIHWLAADTAGSTYVVNSLSFQPKALKFTVCGLHQTSGDASSVTSHIRRGMGFAASTSNRACVGQYDGDNAPTAVCAAIYREDAVVAVVTAAGGVDGMLDLTALASDGFTLTVDDQIAANITVFWEAWGGSDITNAEVLPFAEPATAVAVDYTLAGAFQPDVVMFTGCNLTGASPAVGRSSANWMLGWATGTAASAQSVLAGWAEDTPTTMDTDRYHRTGQCVAAMITSGNSAVTARASLSAFNADGFELTWAERGTTDRRYIALAIKGGLWAAGSTTIDNTTLNATATVSGLPFRPIGGCLFSHHLAQNADDTVTATCAMLWGCFDASLAAKGVFTGDVNGVGTSTVILAISYNVALIGADTAGLAVEYTTASAINNDGFTLTSYDADPIGSATELISYLAFAPEPTPVSGAHISSTAALFAGTVSQDAGDQSVTGVHLAATASLFAGTVTVGAVTVEGATLASAAALNAGSLAYVVEGATTASTATLNAGTVAPGAVTVTGVTIGSTAALSAGTVSQDSGDQGVAGASVASTATLTAGALAYAIAGATCASTLSLTAGSLTYVLAGATLASTVTLHAGTVTPSGSLAGASIASTATLTAGTVSPGAVTVTGGSLATSTTLYAGTVTPGAVTITGSTLASTATLSAGTLTAAVVGATITSTATLSAGSVAAEPAVTGASIVSTVTLNAGTVVPGAITVTGSTIASSVTMTAGTVVAVDAWIYGESVLFVNLALTASRLENISASAGALASVSLSEAALESPSVH